MKTTSDVRNAALIRKISRSRCEFGDTEIIEVKKAGKYAYYIAKTDEDHALFTFCSDAPIDIKDMYDNGGFKDYQKPVN